MAAVTPEAPRNLGRYALHAELASGGMASVRLGKLRGAVGFSRIVAIKRIHPQFAQDADFIAMFLDEARLASRIRHSNVVAPLDVVRDGDELFLVMEYVEGESLAQLTKSAQKRGETVALPLALALIADVLHGLHAVHEATDEQGQPLRIVHRDVTPQNILVGTDGAARIADFGVAKALGRLYTTRSGQAKGKLGYMSPEQLQGQPVSAQSDLYAVGATLWELVVGRKMIEGDSEGELVLKAVSGRIPEVHELVPGVPALVGEAIARATARDPKQRFASALEFAEALEGAAAVATAREIAAWVQRLAEPALAQRRAWIRELEGSANAVVAPAGAAGTEVETNPAVAKEPTTPREGTRWRIALFAALAAPLAALLALSVRPKTPASPPLAAPPEPAVAAVESATPALHSQPSATPPAAASLTAAPLVSAAARSAQKSSSPSRDGGAPRGDGGVSDNLLGRF